MLIEKLFSFHIVEKCNGNFFVWNYPTITDDHKKFILDHCFSYSTFQFICLRKRKNWIYIDEVETIRNFAIILIAGEFEPIKYKQICDILAKKYETESQPVQLVKLYLSLCTEERCSVQNNGLPLSCDLKKFKTKSYIKQFIQHFDLEIILIYTAILLKRRVIIYNPEIEELYTHLLAIRDLVPNRNYQDYLQPLVEAPINLKGLSFYVAGTTIFDLSKQEALYDLFVDVPSKHLKISPKSEEILAMTKMHKSLATFLVGLSTSDLSESQIQLQIAEKNSNVLDLLKNISENQMITISELKSKKYQPSVENFLFNLALAENIMML